MLIVFGSINVDLVMRMDHLPQAGERLLVPSYDWLPGGKGANQAVAAARMETKTAMVGKIGEDGFGTRMVNTFKQNGVMTSGIAYSDYPTGTGAFFFDSHGGKQAVIASGANQDVSEDQVPEDILSSKNVILLQMEVPSEANQAVIHRAAQTGAMVILNLAPAIKIPHDVLVDVDVLIVNRAEGEKMAEALGLDIDKNSKILAQSLAKEGDLTCIMTMSENGSVIAKPDGSGWTCPAYHDMDIVSTTGAGDAYCGVLAAALHDGIKWPEALKRASIAASLTCREEGAQKAMPHKDEVLALLDTLADPEVFNA